MAGLSAKIKDMPIKLGARDADEAAESADTEASEVSDGDALIAAFDAKDGAKVESLVKKICNYSE